MVLSDRDIRQQVRTGGVKIDPFDDARVQPASVDLLLSNEFQAKAEFRTFLNGVIPPSIDLGAAKETYEEDPFRFHKVDDEGFTLRPGEFCLGSTIEYVEIPDYLVGRVEGKSSLGRMGLLIHATAGFIDPGFKGKITLEMYNLNYRPIILRAGLPICQLSLVKMLRSAEFPYGHESLNSHYQDQKRVQESLYG